MNNLKAIVNYQQTKIIDFDWNNNISDSQLREEIGFKSILVMNLNRK